MSNVVKRREFLTACVGAGGVAIGGASTAAVFQHFKQFGRLLCIMLVEIEVEIDVDSRDHADVEAVTVVSGFTD